MLRIRKAHCSEADCLSALALRSKAIWNYDDAFMKACETKLRVKSAKMTDKNFSYFCADLNEHVVGFVAIEFLNDDLAEIEALFVEPEYTGRGIGKLLFEACIDECAHGKFQKIIIRSDPNSIGFYLSRGAVLVGSVASQSIAGRLLPLCEYYFS